MYKYRLKVKWIISSPPPARALSRLTCATFCRLIAINLREQEKAKKVEDQSQSHASPVGGDGAGGVGGGGFGGVIIGGRGSRAGGGPDSAAAAAVPLSEHLRQLGRLGRLTVRKRDEGV